MVCCRSCRDDDDNYCSGLRERIENPDVRVVQSFKWSAIGCPGGSPAKYAYYRGRSLFPQRSVFKSGMGPLLQVSPPSLTLTIQLKSPCPSSGTHENGKGKLWLFCACGIIDFRREIVGINWKKVKPVIDTV